MRFINLYLQKSKKEVKVNDVNLQSQTVSQTVLLDSNFHKQLLTVNQKKSSEKMALLNGNDSRWFVSVDDILVVEDTAYIPISGVLLHSSDELCVRGWFTDYSFLHKQIQMVYQNDSIKKVVFNVDSPGGMALGMDAIASEIKELSLVKETMAIVNGLCCSAAYMLSANCNKIYAGQGSFIGSIGVFCLIVDDKEYYEKLGLKIYSVGKPHGKTLGRTGQEVTEEVIQRQQASCDETFECIVDIVSSKLSREKIMELDAESFSSQVALSHGLIDAVLTAEQTLTNTFPKEETVSKQETNPETTPPAQASEVVNTGQKISEQSSEKTSEKSSQELDVKALISGIGEAVKEGVSQGVALALDKANQESTTPQQSTLDVLPQTGLQAFERGDQHFENTQSPAVQKQEEQQNSIRNAFNSLSGQGTTTQEIVVNATKGVSHA